MNTGNNSLLARIMIMGDTHLSSRKWGAHRDYPKESLDNFKKVTKLAEDNDVTHIIGLGDFSFDRFKTLEYRYEVEELLKRQYKQTNGNRYELKGNHDKATYGMTEYEYYIAQGLLKPSCNLQIGLLNISMIDYSKQYDFSKIITPDSNKFNLVLAHDFFKFKDSLMANYGEAIILDDTRLLYGVDMLISGHVHNWGTFGGKVTSWDGSNSRDMMLRYLGCMNRPSYREGHMQDVGKVNIVEIYEDGSMKINEIDIPLMSIEEAFNLEKLEKVKQHRENTHIDISDVVKSLENHERNIGEPEDIIKTMTVDQKYKDKAIELLELAKA